MFVDHTPEYRRTFPEYQLPIYPTPYEAVPNFGLFGFPYRAGWKAAGWLTDQGRLAGVYNSNEEAEITNYYTRQAERCTCKDPDLYLTATYVQDVKRLDWPYVKREYAPAVIGTVERVARLTVYQRKDMAPASPEKVRVEEIERAFDLGSTPERVAAVDYR